MAVNYAWLLEYASPLFAYTPLSRISDRPWTAFEAIGGRERRLRANILISQSWRLPRRVVWHDRVGGIFWPFVQFQNWQGDIVGFQAFGILRQLDASPNVTGQLFRNQRRGSIRLGRPFPRRIWPDLPSTYLVTEGAVFTQTKCWWPVRDAVNAQCDYHAVVKRVGAEVTARTPGFFLSRGCDLFLQEIMSTL